MVRRSPSQAAAARNKNKKQRDMKKRHSIQILLAVAAIFFAATACTQDDQILLAVAAIFFAATACTQDELADGDRLPEGQYPLEIAAVTLSVEGGEAQPWDAPQTRVSETGDGTGSKWDGNEEIDVQIEGSTETATYIVQANGTVSSPTRPFTGATVTPTPSPPGILLQTAHSISATKQTALPTCCTARAGAIFRIR